MRSLAINDLVTRLGRSDNLNSDETFVRTGRQDDAFVPPPLIWRRGELTAPTVLISAAAAVGKTTLANHLTAASNAILWDLSRMRLGDAVLVGSLGRAYGYDHLGEVIPALARGTSSLILDGLDEAYVRSGIDGLEALAHDMGAILEEAPTERSAFSFIVLGRSTAVELFQLILDERQIPTLELSIGFFPADHARILVDRQAGERARSAPTYGEARDRLLDAIRLSIGREAEPEDVRSFLGYAPVLSALGRYLVDPDEVLAALDVQAAQGSAFWQQLARVAEDILERETQKVRAQLERSDLVSEYFFSSAHQKQVLLADSPFSVLEEGWKAAQEGPRRQAIQVGRTALETHPFLRADTVNEPFGERFVNTVFRDFLVAETLRDENALENFVEIDEAFWRGDYAPSALAAFFYLLPDADGNSNVPVDPELLGLLVSSLAAEMPSHTEPVSIVIENGDDSLDISVGRRSLSQTIDFNVRVGRDVTLGLSSPISHLVANVSSNVLQLRTAGEEIALGPRVSLTADALEIDSAKLIVHAADAPVVLRAQNIRFSGSHLTVDVESAAELEVDTPDPPYPFRRFVVTPTQPSVSDAKLNKALLELRRLLAWFEAGPIGEVSYFKRPLDTAVAKGRISGAMLEYALRRNLLQDNGKMYVLHPDNVQLDLFKLRRGDLDGALRAFLLPYAQSR